MTKYSLTKNLNLLMFVFSTVIAWIFANTKTRTVNIGGQAVFEGVMIRGKDKYVISVRKKNKKIITKTIHVKGKNVWYNSFPIIRGVARFAESLVIGTKALIFSMDVTTEEEDYSFSGVEIGITIFFSMVLSIGLFFILPLVITHFFTLRINSFENNLFFNLIDGVLRIMFFLIYITLISFLPDIRRIFQYHGAEHKVVSCYEKGDNLNVENAKKHTRIHPRCGTNFIIIVFIVSLVIFSLFNVQTFLEGFILRIVFLPLIAGLSYEWLMIGGRFVNNPIIKFTILPGLLIQRITTKEPDDEMLEVALKSIKAAVS